MVTHAFYNSNNSTRDFCNRHLESCNMLFELWSQANAYDPSDLEDQALKPGLYIVVTVAEHACDDAS